MNTNLPSFPPDRHTAIQDDTIALRYAAAFEMMSDTFLDSPFPATFITSQNHNTHWLVVILNKGHASPEDNGLSFYAIPKSMLSLDKVKSMIISQCGDSYIEIENSSKPTDK